MEPLPAPPPEQPLRGPFDDLFSERPPSEIASSDSPPWSDVPPTSEPSAPFGAQPARTEAASPFGAQPAREEPIRTPWHPPALGGDDQPSPASDAQPSIVSEGALAPPSGELYAPYDPYGPVPPGGTAPYRPYGAYGSGAAEGTLGAPPARRSVARPAGRLLRELAETVILALVIFLLVRAVVQNFQVEGKSMEPSLESGWYLLVDKALYWEVDLNTVHKFLPFVHPGEDPTRYLFRGPKRGDIIVFVAPDQVPGSPERDFIKRVIGLPGDTIEVKNCTVYVNGKPLAENYIQDVPAYTYPTNGSGPVTVPKGQYFVLGDNRNNSSDSHSWGFVPKQNIIGQAWVVYWPFHHMGFVKNVDIKPGTNNNAPAAGSKLTGACSTPQ